MRPGKVVVVQHIPQDPPASAAMSAPTGPFGRGGLADDHAPRAGPGGPEPFLEVVHGPDRGSVYYLTPDSQGASGWTIGRTPWAAVPLLADPFVSRENTVVRRLLGGFEVMDAPNSRNGTLLNGRLLPAGVPHRLRPGDVLQVGRSVLTFRSR